MVDDEVGACATFGLTSAAVVFVDQMFPMALRPSAPFVVRAVDGATR